MPVSLLADLVEVQELVIDRIKPHCPSTRLCILLSVLGTCVFFWGIGYKLSLYSTHQPNLQRIPAAKLLSKNEDPNLKDAPTLTASGENSFHQQIVFLKAALIVLWTLAVCAAISDSVVRRLEKPHARDLRVAVILGELFFRPPPIHSVL